MASTYQIIPSQNHQLTQRTDAAFSETTPLPTVGFGGFSQRITCHLPHCLPHHHTAGDLRADPTHPLLSSGHIAGKHLFEQHLGASGPHWGHYLLTDGPSLF